MDYPNSITSHRKNKHLQLCHRVIIELRLRDGYSAYKIAKELGCAANTIRNEIRRGTVSQIRQGKYILVYFADAGQRNYQANRRHSVRKFKRFQAKKFIDHVIEKMRSQKWPIDACVGEAISQNRFNRCESVCTKTLYNYVDLPQKLRRNTKSARVQKNKRKLGTSITERSPDIEDRKEFGHWEIDTVIGKKPRNTLCY